MISRNYFKRSNAKTKVVDVPGFEPVRVRELSYAEYAEALSISKAMRAVSEREREGEVMTAAAIRGPARIVVLSLGNEDGSRMLTDEDIEDVMRQPFEAVMSLANACVTSMAESVTAVEDAEKK